MSVCIPKRKRYILYIPFFIFLCCKESVYCILSIFRGFEIRKPDTVRESICNALFVYRSNGGATEKENTSPAKAMETTTKSKIKNDDSFFIPSFSHISLIIQAIAR